MASSSASKYFEIPKWFVFSVKGIYSGSCGERDFNYKIVPVCPKEGDKCLRAHIWRGQNCIDLSDNIDVKDFNFTEEGYCEMLKWLEEQFLSREIVKTPFEKCRERAHMLEEKYFDIDDYFERALNISRNDNNDNGQL